MWWVKGENVPQPGVPESFKVLIKELQSLALDIKVLSDTREVIEIGESVDEDEPVVMDVNIAGTEDAPPIVRPGIDEFAEFADFEELDDELDDEDIDDDDLLLDDEQGDE